MAEWETVWSRPPARGGMPVDGYATRSKLHLPHGERFRSRRSARNHVRLSAIPGAGAVCGGSRRRPAGSPFRTPRRLWHALAGRARGHKPGAPDCGIIQRRSFGRPGWGRFPRVACCLEGTLRPVASGGDREAHAVPARRRHRSLPAGGPPEAADGPRATLGNLSRKGETELCSSRGSSRSWR